MKFRRKHKRNKKTDFDRTNPSPRNLNTTKAPSQTEVEIKTEAPEIQPLSNSQWKFELFSLCAIYGLLVFRLLFPFIHHGATTENDELRLYITGWITTVACGLLLGWFAYGNARKRFTNAGLGPYIFFNFFFLLFLMTPVSQIPNRNGTYIIIFLAIQTVGFFLVRFNLTWKIGGEILGNILYGVCMLSFFGWVLYLNNKGIITTLKNWTPAQYILGGFILWIFSKSLRAYSDKKTNNGITESFHSSGIILYGFVFLGIAFLIYNPFYSLDISDLNPFIGPLADQVTGKILLVDVFGQYGILNYLILGKIFQFIPLDFKTFIFSDTVFRICQYFLFYLVAEKLFGQRLYTYFCVCFFILVNHFAISGWASAYFSVGPLRFGLIYLLLALVVFRNTRPDRLKMFWFLEAIVAGAAFFWSTKTLFYIFLPYLILVLYETMEFNGRLRVDRKSLILRLGMIFGVLLAITGWIYLDCFMRSGLFPNWFLYLDYIRMFNLGASPMPAQGIWWTMAGILYLSFFAVMALFFQGTTSSSKPHLNAIFLTVIFGIFQFSFYMERSFPETIFQISMPFILLTAYWIFYLRRFNPMVIPGVIKNGIFILVLLSMALYVPTIFPKIWKNIKYQTSPSQKTFESLRDVFKGPRPDAWSSLAGQLIEKHSGRQKRIPYFLGINGLKVCLYTKKESIYPYIDLSVATISKSIEGWISQKIMNLKPGDYIYFLDKYLAKTGYLPNEHIVFLSPADPFGKLETRLLRQIDSRCPVEFVEQTNGIVVGRLNHR